MKCIARLFIGTSLAASLAACGGGLSGEYGQINEINGKWDTLFTFKGNQVEMAVFGTAQVGSYKVDDGKVYLTIGGQTQAMKINAKGCLEGGLMFGTVCKRG